MRNLNALALFGSVLFMSASVFAKDEPYLSAGHKMLGHQAQSYQQHAQDRVQTLYSYGPSKQSVPKAEAKELVDGIRKDLKASQTALAKLQAEFSKNKEAIALIDSIKKHHAKVEENCGMAEEACMKQDQDEAMIGDCCSVMYHELEAAKADTQKLLKLLNIEKPEPPKKSAAKSPTTKK